MKSSFPGLSAKAAAFDSPLEMLDACHERIHAQCATLRRLAAHIAKAGVDDAASTAAHNVIRYFDTAGRHHHEDEEEDLFPALLESMAGSNPVCIRQLVDSLKSEHRELDLRWQALRASLACIESGDAVVLRQADVDELAGRYARHIAREEQELLPMAARLLDASTLERIGQSMSRRRGVRSEAERDRRRPQR